ncbi:hypothetical protein R9X49_06400 [Pectobacterium carotovorum]|uniref:hypothetical protein n=1 Tax=Pectobacterium carotovorum TaxID=554 RepID=UPI0029D8360F|nr:hypothetical protein [Pectobacterium carotovorum]MDX6914736.1 hypothetical protein [Pectobacterium carotovorum]
MKRSPFYRRGGRDSQNKGMKEKIIWQLQKHGRPMTGSELAEIFKMDVTDLNKCRRFVVSEVGQSSVSVEKIVDDFIYTLMKNPEIKLVKNRKLMSCRVSYKSFATSSRISKIKHIAEAIHRRELIARGEYISG